MKVKKNYCWFKPRNVIVAIRRPRTEKNIAHRRRSLPLYPNPAFICAIKTI